MTASFECDPITDTSITTLWRYCGSFEQNDVFRGLLKYRDGFSFFSPRQDAVHLKRFTLYRTPDNNVAYKHERSRRQQAYDKSVFGSHLSLIEFSRRAFAAENGFRRSVNMKTVHIIVDNH